MIFKVDLGTYLPIKPILIMDFGFWGPDVSLKRLFSRDSDLTSSFWDVDILKWDVDILSKDVDILNKMWIYY